MSRKVLDELKESEIDIYDLLQVPNDASDATIRKAYRKQALIYHPDKNPSQDAAHTFHFLGLALTVLSDAQLRTDYDNWVRSKEQEKIRNEQLTNDRKRMRDDLEKAETDAISKQTSSLWMKKSTTEGTSRYNTEIERLREEGIKKRRDFEADYLSKLSYKSKSQHTNNNYSRTVKIKWKIKEGIAELFTEDIIEGIFSIFGEVEQVEKLPRRSNENRYDSGKVVFKTTSGAARAVSHDFSVKSKIWDKTSYRKLSGLMREAKWLKGSNGGTSSNVLNKDRLTLEEYKDMTLLKLQKLVT